MSRSLKIHEFITLKQRCIHTGNIFASGPVRLPEKSKGSNPSHRHVHESLKAIRSLVSGDSKESTKVKKLLGVDKSWVTQRPKQYGLKPPKREREKKIEPGSKRVTLPSLLHPHEVSQKIKELAAIGKIYDAIDYVSNLPLDALNVQVWNTLIWEVNRMSKYTVAWSLFNEMKKRGFEPSTYSYKTMLNGLVRIDDFKKHSMSLGRADILYSSFIKYTNDLRDRRPDHPELYPVPIHFYMTILAKAGMRSKMWDVFYAMNKEGPMAPDASTFTHMLQYLDVRPPDERLPDSEWNRKVASEAAVIWRLMVSGSQGKPGFKIDSHALAIVLRRLAKGTPGEHQLAFEIVHEYLGLYHPDAWREISKSGKRPSKKGPRETLNQFTYQAALELCREANTPEYATAYSEQIMDVQSEVSIMDVHNMDRILSSYFKTGGRLVDPNPEHSDVQQSKTPPQLAVSNLQWLLSHAAAYYSVKRPKEEVKELWPTAHTYNIALAICRDCKDWETTCKVIEMMTNQTVVRVKPSANGASGSTTGSTHIKPHTPIFSLLGGSGRPAYQRRQYFRVTPESLFNIMRCACDYGLKHNKPVTAHECLSTIHALGGAELLTEPFAASRVTQHYLEQYPSQQRQAAKLDEMVQQEEERKKYWAVRAAAIVPALFDLATKSGGWNREEYKKAVDFRSAATGILKVQKGDIKRKQLASKLEDVD